MTPGNLGQFLQVDLLMAVRSIIAVSDILYFDRLPPMHKGIKDNEPILVSRLIKLNLYLSAEHTNTIHKHRLEHPIIYGVRTSVVYSTTDLVR